MAHWDVSVEVDDKVGALAELGEAMGAAGINLDGIWTHQRDGKAHVHVLVSDREACEKAVKAKGWTVHRAHEVLVAACENRAGWLGEQCRKLADAGLNVEWCYMATDNRIVVSCKDLAKAREVWGKVGAASH